MHGYLIGTALALITVLSLGWNGNSAWPVSGFSRWRGTRIGRDGAVRIGIPMNLADFRVNRAPVAGRVRPLAPVRDTFRSLRKPKMLFTDERVTALLDAGDLQVDLLLPDWADIKVTAQAGDQLTVGRSAVSLIISKHGGTGREFPERDAESHHSVVPDHPVSRAMGGLDSGG